VFSAFTLERFVFPETLRAENLLGYFEKFKLRMVVGYVVEIYGEVGLLSGKLFCRSLNLSHLS
jgi:hypothetical protein